MKPIFVEGLVITLCKDLSVTNHYETVHHFSTSVYIFNKVFNEDRTYTYIFGSAILKYVHVILCLIIFAWYTTYYVISEFCKHLNIQSITRRGNNIGGRIESALALKLGNHIGKIIGFGLDSLDDLRLLFAFKVKVDIRTV